MTRVQQIIDQLEELHRQAHEIFDARVEVILAGQPYGTSFRRNQGELHLCAGWMDARLHQGVEELAGRKDRKVAAYNSSSSNKARLARAFAFLRQPTRKHAGIVSAF